MLELEKNTNTKSTRNCRGEFKVCRTPAQESKNCLKFSLCQKI